MSAWIPVGQQLSLNIKHRPLNDTGGFTGGGWKIVWHTTEGDSLEGAYSTLKSKNSAPHFIIAPSGEVIQTVGLDRAARALAHPSGPETNRANAIQVECVGHAASSGGWSDDYYRHLADLFVLIHTQVPIPNMGSYAFKGPRLTGNDFVNAQGHLGHIHVPGNSHWDPGPSFRIVHLEWEIFLRTLTYYIFGP